MFLSTREGGGCIISTLTGDDPLLTALLSTQHMVVSLVFIMIFHPLFD
jgi:hypothetical protein